MKWQVSKIWSGICWVIGGGQSVADMFNVPKDLVPETREEFEEFGEYLKPIHDDHVIGVNLAAFLGQWVDVAYWGDSDTYNMYRSWYDSFSGLKVASAGKFTQEKFKSIKHLYRDYRGGLQKETDRVSWPRIRKKINGVSKIVNAGNSGAAAISLAYHLGCTEIRLLGFDMKNGSSGRIHFHTGYPNKDHVITNKMVKEGNTKIPREPRKTAPYHKHGLAFLQIAEDAERLGIKIINVNPDSGITEFEKKSLDDILLESKKTRIVFQCPLCLKGRLNKLKGKVNGISNILQCDTCKTHKQVINFDLLDYYKNKYHQDGIYKYERDHDLATNSIRFEKYNLMNLFKKDDLCLDYGTGNGAFVEHCRNNMINCFGMDITNINIKNPFVYTKDNLQDVNFPTEYFGNVFVHDVLEHLENPREVLKELYRIIKESGKLIIEYPDFYSNEGKHHWKEDEHIWMMKRGFLDSLLSEIGFDVTFVYLPIPGKLTFVCVKEKKKNISILVPPGIGDIHWVMVKLQSFLEKNDIRCMPDVYICSFDNKKDRSLDYLKMIPFINAKGYKYLEKTDVPWKEAYHETGRTVFKDIAGCDYFIAYNGHLREPKRLDEIDPIYKCNYDLPMFESKEQIEYGPRFKKEHGEYIVGYFIDHGIYKKNWSDILTHDKLTWIIDKLSNDLNCKLILIGAEWDIKCEINLFLIKHFPDRIVNMLGRTKIEDVFSILKNAKGVIGFPSGITIMSTFFKIPTFIFWSTYFNDVFWEAACYPISKCDTYAYCDVDNCDADVVVKDFKRITNSSDYTKYVVCVLKSGGDYTVEYVDNLRRGVFNNLTYDFQFRCLTDMKLNIPNEEIVEFKKDLPGWWSKLEVFRDDIYENDAQVLYLDLDTIITGNIDYMFENMKPGFHMLEGFSTRLLHASGIMYFDTDLSFIYDHLMTMYNKISTFSKSNGKFKKDQEFIYSTYKRFKGKSPFKIKRDNGNILSFKKHVLNKKSLKESMNKASIVCFHGKPRPHEVLDDFVLSCWKGGEVC